MQTYAMHFNDVLALPLPTFWMLHRNVNRIAAEKDQRSVAVVGHAFAGGDGLSEFVDHLREEMGSAFVEDASQPDSSKTGNPVLDMEFDAEGLAALKGMGNL